MIDTVTLLDSTVFSDSRGYFSVVFEESNFSPLHFVQENLSLSHMNVFRGFHYQVAPFVQAKIIRVISGSIVDYSIDIRKNSIEFGKLHVYDLRDPNSSLFIPEGFAHGFLALEDNTRIIYKVSKYYNKNSERTILYSDIISHNNNYILSQKDADGISFSNAEYL
jgi:dTDP-4-dehydrorhamnose 3,5-epimerase